MPDRDPSIFDRRADAYDRAGLPTHPRCTPHSASCVLETGLRVLEVGAGSGQATATFAEAGADVSVAGPGALHWVDLWVGLPLLHRALVPGGVLAS